MSVIQKPTEVQRNKAMERLIKLESLRHYMHLSDKVCESVNRFDKIVLSGLCDHGSRRNSNGSTAWNRCYGE